MYDRNFFHIIKNVCAEYDIKICEIIPNHLIQLLYKNNINYVYSHRFPLNSEVSGKIMDDKFCCNNILNLHQIPTISYEYIKFTNGKMDLSSYDLIDKMMNKYGCVVVKPNTGLQGYCVERCNSFNATVIAANDIHSKGFNTIISPFYIIKEEYRIVVIDGSSYLCYRKIKKDGEWRHNLSLGALPSLDCESIDAKNAEKIAIMASNAIGCRCACVDVVKFEDNRLAVLEMNPGITLDIFMDSVENGYDIAFKIYDCIIKTMFKL